MSLRNKCSHLPAMKLGEVLSNLSKPQLAHLENEHTRSICFIELL